MEKKQQESAEGILKNILYFMGVVGEISSSYEEQAIYLNINTKDNGILIGYKGENLQALQYLINLLLHNEYGPGVFARVDVGGYKKEQEEKLKNMAKDLAKRVKETGRSEVLRPMTPSERRLVHTVISEFPDIDTESTGEDPFRRIVIRKKG